jgi:hypothetical protein
MLYLTYDNEVLADGAGAQIQRIISIYLISKIFSVGYIHQGLKRMTYQGAKCMEENKEDPEQIAMYNELIQLPSTPCTEIHQMGKVFDISEEIISQYRDETKNTLLVIQFAGTMMDARPGFLLPGPHIFTWNIRPSLIARPVIVAIHVRRGELFVLGPGRMLPNSYYIECMEALHSIFTEANISYEFHLHTEVLTKPTLITPSHHGICDRIPESVLVTPEDSKMEDFNVIPNIKYHINEHPVDTLKALTLSDVLLASRSSFSYVASILKLGGVVLFHPFWHSLAPGWIPTRGKDDILAAKHDILRKLRGA